MSLTELMMTIPVPVLILVVAVAPFAVFFRTGKVWREGRGELRGYLVLSRFAILSQATAHGESDADADSDADFNLSLKRRSQLS